MEFPNSFGRLLVICPHFDDACFSVGGFLLKKQSESITMLTVFSKSQHAPHYRFFHPLMITSDYLHLNFSKRTIEKVISQVRKKEDSRYCRQIRAAQGVLSFEDSSLRRCPSYYQIFNGTEIDKDPISISVFETIEKWVFSKAFDSILCPLGIGNQIDHLIVLNALLKMLEKQPAQVNVFFYEDLPYTAFYKLDQIDSLVFERIVSNNATYIDVTDEMPLKQRLMDIYYSQGQEKASILRHAQRLFASKTENSGHNGFYERIWKFGPS